MSDTPRPLIAPDSRREECDPAEPHYHVWRDVGYIRICQRPRFRTRQNARKAAIRAGMKPGTFAVARCVLPCRFTIPQVRPRKPRKRCRHCGKVP